MRVNSTCAWKETLDDCEDSDSNTDLSQLDDHRKYDFKHDLDQPKVDDLADAVSLSDLGDKGEQHVLDIDFYDVCDREPLPCVRQYGGQRLIDSCEEIEIQSSPVILKDSFHTSVTSSSNSSLRITGVGAGLANLGNTCFMNSILQCFTHTIPLIKGLHSFRNDLRCGSSEFCALCALRGHINLALESTGKIISPFGFFYNLSYFSSYFRRYQQEDAHEFLQCFLDKLESCANLHSERSQIVPAKNLVEQIFGGRLVSRLWCSDCGYCSERYEPFIDMSLEIEDADSLEGALESFTKLEKIDDADARMICERCHAKTSMEKQLMLDRLPRVAVFHLKRFKTSGFSVDKISKHVSFPLELNMYPYTDGVQEQDAEFNYKLFAFVVHYGHLPTSGHYLTYVRSSPETWHRLDDVMVTQIDEDEVISEDAYILFYAQESSPWFSSLVEMQDVISDSRSSKPSPTSVLSDMDDLEHDSSPRQNSNTAAQSHPQHVNMSWEDIMKSHSMVSPPQKNSGNDAEVITVEDGGDPRAEMPTTSAEYNDDDAHGGNDGLYMRPESSNPVEGEGSTEESASKKLKTSPDMDSRRRKQ